MCFVCISEQTAIISLYSINRLVFITEAECVYCAVRTGSLCVIQFNFMNSQRLQSCSLTQIASRLLCCNWDCEGSGLDLKLCNRL
jgi:hypothetical protein